MTKKQLTWIFIVVVILIIAVLIYSYRDKLFGVKDHNKDNEPVPPNSPTPKWITESFPLNLGMYGVKIKALQSKLGIIADGKFGTQTKNAIEAKNYTVPLSEVDYNKIINPIAAGGGSNFTQLKQALSGASTNFSSGVSYVKQGQNKNYRFDFYTTGRFIVNTIGTNDALKRGTYFDGGKNMSIDSGSTYSGTVYTNMTSVINLIGG